MAVMVDSRFIGVLVEAAHAEGLPRVVAARVIDDAVRRLADRRRWNFTWRSRWRATLRAALDAVYQDGSAAADAERGGRDEHAT
jgi:hypothetical protein